MKNILTNIGDFTIAFCKFLSKNYLEAQSYAGKEIDSVCKKSFVRKLVYILFFKVEPQLLKSSGNYILVVQEVVDSQIENHEI